MNRMVSMSPRERLEHMAEMYDAYGYGGVMVGGRRRSKSKSMKAGAVKPVYWKKSKSAACKSKSKTSKSGRLLNDYQRFVQQERCNGLTMVEIGRLWRKIKKTYGGVSKKKSGSKKRKESRYGKCIKKWSRRGLERKELQAKYNKLNKKCKKLGKQAPPKRGSAIMMNDMMGSEYDMD